MFKITIDNEEVLCDKDFTIKEEMLNTSSVILNNVFPKTWEQDKDYVSRFYYPKDYSKCKIFEETIHPADPGTTIENTSMSINYDNTKKWDYFLKGQTSQSGTPTPTSPQPINITTGRQVVSVCEKNMFNPNNITSGLFYNTSNGSETSSGVWSQSSFIGVSGGTKISISSNYSVANNSYEISQFNESKQWLEGTQFSLNTSKTYTLNANAKYIRIGFRSDRDTTNKLQIEKNNQPSTYEEYKGNDYEINLGKNLFDLANATYTTKEVSVSINDNVITQTNTNSYARSIWKLTNLDIGKNYTFSCDFTNENGCSVRLSVSNGNDSTIIVNSNTSTATSGKLTISFTATEQTQSLRIYSNTTATSNNYSVDYTNLQLEKGSTGSSYSPYKSPIYLGKIGTYQDYIFKNTQDNPLYDSNLNENEWYIHKEIGRVVLNGSESWEDKPNYTYADRFVINNLISTFANTELGFSNYFEIKKYAQNTYPYLYLNTGQIGINYTSKGTTTLAQFKTWLNSHNVEVYYVLNTPTNTLIEDEELINQLNSIELLEGLNNVSMSSPYLPFIMSLLYNYVPAYTTEDLIFCGIVKNTGDISLNPRYPHYCNVQVLDFKDFLSQGETLDFVITDKTIYEAIDQVIGTIAPYGFIKGNIELDSGSYQLGAYSTKDKTAYDVFNYIADITQSRWKTRMIDENTIAIDFYDPDELPQGTAIEYTQTWFENNKIDDMSFSYSSNDYRNKQVMLSGEVYSNIETTEIIVADGYQTKFNTLDKIGKVSSIKIDGNPATIITKDEENLGYEGDFIFQPGNTYFESDTLLTSGKIITIVYFAIIEGREIILNQQEIERVGNMTNRKGIIARYENRNDATTTYELQQIGKAYLKYKGTPEINLKVSSRSNIWNIGDRVQFTAPLTELSTEYMVKRKTIERITTIDDLFYEFELTSSFNMERDVNYFDNQRYKSNGNIGKGEFISRNVDINNTANVIFYDLEVNEITMSGSDELQADLQAPLGVE